MIGPKRLLGELQLAFILLLHLSSFSALAAYKRLLPLFTRSKRLLIDPKAYLESSADIKAIISAFICAVAVQITAFPAGTFETELPELDVFYLDEIESLRSHILAAGHTTSPKIEAAWKELQKAGTQWGWSITDLSSTSAAESDSEEEGEYAPVVVEM